MYHTVCKIIIIVQPFSRVYTYQHMVEAILSHSMMEERHLVVLGSDLAMWTYLHLLLVEHPEISEGLEDGLQLESRHVQDHTL